jgi:hypothetical protein
VRFHPDVRHLAEAIEPRTEETVERARQLIAKMGPYAGGLVDDGELKRSVALNFRYMIDSLGDRSAVDLSAPREIGRLRGQAGVPLPELLRAYRIGFAELWRVLVIEARRAGPKTYDALIDAATEIWSLADDYSQAVTDAYREATSGRVIADASRRSALLEALLLGEPAESGTVWEIADRLRLPFTGTFIVVAAQTPEPGEDPLAGIENRLAAKDFASAWRLTAGLESGLISCGSTERVDVAVALLNEVATTRVGVSAPFERLDEAGEAWRVARLAMTSALGSVGYVRRFLATPLAMLAASDPATSRRVAREVLGEVLDLAPAERDVLLDTLEAWLDVHGSARAAGQRLFVHPNTVRHRLRRLETLTGQELEDPRALAQLAAAAQAVRLFPDLIDR